MKSLVKIPTVKGDAHINPLRVEAIWDDTPRNTRVIILFSGLRIESRASEATLLGLLSGIAMEKAG